MDLVEGLQKGSAVEVFSGEDWWDAEIVKVEGTQVRVHYVGGAEEEDEWISSTSSRIRVSRSGTAAPGHKTGKRSREPAAEPVPVPSSLPFKQATVRDKGIKKQWKNLKKIIEAENFDKLPLDAPTYTNIEAPPSLLPPKKYCDLTGLHARYTDPKTRLRYYSASEYVQLRYISEHNVQEFLRVRNAIVNLK